MTYPILYLADRITANVNYCPQFVLSQGSISLVVRGKLLKCPPYSLENKLLL
jgi:hypothetical protein